jgi:hypothetical protein
MQLQKQISMNGIKPGKAAWRARKNAHLNSVLEADQSIGNEQASTSSPQPASPNRSNLPEHGESSAHPKGNLSPTNDSNNEDSDTEDEAESFIYLHYRYEVRAARKWYCIMIQDLHEEDGGGDVHHEWPQVRVRMVWDCDIFSKPSVRSERAVEGPVSPRMTTRAVQAE